MIYWQHIPSGQVGFCKTYEAFNVFADSDDISKITEAKFNEAIENGEVCNPSLKVYLMNDEEREKVFNEITDLVNSLEALKGYFQNPKCMKFTHDDVKGVYTVAEYRSALLLDKFMDRIYKHTKEYE